MPLVSPYGGSRSLTPAQLQMARVRIALAMRMILHRRSRPIKLCATLTLQRHLRVLIR